MDFQFSLNSETVEHADPAQPLVVQPFEPVAHVLRRMRKERTGAVLVCRDDVLVGVFTERDALKMLASQADLNVPVEDVMTRNPTTVRACDTVATAIRKMSFGGFRRLPIVDGAGRPVGLMKATRIVRYMVEHFPTTVYTLPAEPHPTVQAREGA